MPRTDEAKAFFHAVYSAIQEVPHGKVTSYGHIARLIGTRETPFLTKLPFRQWNRTLKLQRLTCKPAQRPRQVGVCLKHLSSDTSQTFHNGNVPWQRVINSKGIISPR
jgi:methylated-DNA-protein-cysteine methyltransferase related protein